MKPHASTKLRSLTWTSLLALALFLSASTGHAALITSIQDAFTDPNWSLSWNSGGALGNPANYTPQHSTTNPIAGHETEPFYAGIVADKFFLFSFYSIDAGYEGIMGGHPGPGFSNIFKYTLATSGSFEVQNSVFTSIYSASTGMDVFIYLNNSATPLAFSSIAGGTAGATTSMNVSLGNLTAGDALYFVVSPGLSNSADQFAVALDIVSVPEPSTMILLIGAGAMLAFSRTRKSARAEII